MYGESATKDIQVAAGKDTSAAITGEQYIQDLAQIASAIDVKGATIAMTGGATGLGAVVVDNLVKLGAEKIIVIDIRADKLAELEQKYPGKVKTITANLAKVDDAGYEALAGLVTDLSRDATGKPKLDVFFGNAGILKATPLQPYEATHDYTLQEIFTNFAVNAAANPLLFKHMKPVLEASGGRFIFTTSPTSGRTTDTKYPWYGSAKAYQEQAMGCVGTGNPEVPVLAFDPGRLDATGVRAEAYPNEVPGAQPAPEDIMAPLLLMMSKGTDINGLKGQVIQVNNLAVDDVKKRKVNPRSAAENGQEGFDVIIKKRPLASLPGTGGVIATYNTAHSRAAIGSAPLTPYEPDGKTLGEIFGLPSQQINLETREQLSQVKPGPANDTASKAAHETGYIERDGDHKGEIYGGVFPDGKPGWILEEPKPMTHYDAVELKGRALPTSEEGKYIDTIKGKGDLKDIFARHSDGSSSAGYFWLAGHYYGLARGQQFSDGSQFNYYLYRGHHLPVLSVRR
jgi:NAD(P)-dependent dehydrogenase (short-subunit alcohol dehydrogenase family)